MALPNTTGKACTRAGFTKKSSGRRPGIGYTGTRAHLEVDLSRTVTLDKPEKREPGCLPQKIRSASKSAAPREAASSTAKWLVIASGKGGTSKTTISLNLATVAAASGLRVGVLDTDEQATLSKWHARREAFRSRHPEEAVLPILLFARPLADLDKAIREIEDTSGIDLIIVDTPPGLEQRLLISRLIRRANFVLVPTSQSTADLESAEEFMGAATAFGNHAAFLLSRTNQRWGSYRVAKKLLNSVGNLCPIDVRDLRDIEATHDHGLGINEFGGKAKGSDDVEAVWQYVRKALEI
jgi:chromosome partitioning protein